MTKTLTYLFDVEFFKYDAEYDYGDVAEFFLSYVPDKYCTKESKAAIKSLVECDILQISDYMEDEFEEWLHEQKEDDAKKSWQRRKAK